MDLVSKPCKELCNWAETPTPRDGKKLFECSGCGSQWMRGEPWTPRQHDGTTPPAVQAEILISQPWLAFGSGGS